MGRREQERCWGYRQELERAKARLAEIEEKGAATLSDYDRKIAFQGDDERAVSISKYLVTNHVHWFEAKVAECDRLPKQATLFDLGDAR